MIIEDIQQWIGTLPKWQQKLSALILENECIDEKIEDDIYKIFKIESSLEDGIIPEDKDLVNIKKDKEFHNIVWNGVKNIHGVNRLKKDEKLDISEGLTLIYGENGSGKSGYTRLLNRAFVSRGDQEILGNIYSSENEEISAEFIFKIDDKTVCFNFPRDRHEFPFQSIRNFDSKSASNDMMGESVIDFAPSELSFFDSLLKHCLSIQEKLNKELESKKKDNPVLKYFTKNGEALNQMKKLSWSTTVDELKENFFIDEDDKTKYKKISREKISLQALNINKQISLIDNIIDSLNEASEKKDAFCKATSVEKIDGYNQQILFFKKCNSINNRRGLMLFKDDGIELIGSNEWKEFIKSAKIYYDKIKNHTNCPLCGKEIHKEDLILKYWQYLESDSENNYKIAREGINLIKEALKKLNLLFLGETTVQFEWLINNFKKETEEISEYFFASDNYRNQLITSLEQGVTIVSPPKLKTPDIQGLILKIKKLKEGLNQESINKRINECIKLEDEYVDKMKVNELLPVIEEYLKYLKWEHKVQKSKVNTRSITKKQKELFEKYVTDDYLETFKTECNKLKANFDIEIVSRGKSGQTLKKLQIKNTLPGKILSEGEQRAVSIANFLTEVNMDANNRGIVLDDPVSSLDHRRRTRIAERLLEEACRRQVIVFTHEISFFMEMKVKAEKSKINFQQKTIRKIGDEPGNISSIIPWQGMGVKERTKKLKDDLQNIISIYNSGKIDEYYYEAKKWCELLRESWERAVEEILLNDAIQRYNPCVQTQRLKKAPFSQNLYYELEKGMSECSGWCHDQARALNENIPSIEDLKKYIESFEKYCKTNRSK